MNYLMQDIRLSLNKFSVRKWGYKLPENP